MSWFHFDQREETSQRDDVTWFRFSPVGGRGGGILHFDVSFILEVEGRISASGQSATNATFSGGGAGGSILMRTDVLRGSGEIEVSG